VILYILSLNPHIATGGHRHQSWHKAVDVGFSVTLCAPHVNSISQAYDLCRAQLPREGILWSEGGAPGSDAMFIQSTVEITCTGCSSCPYLVLYITFISYNASHSIPSSRNLQEAFVMSTASVVGGRHVILSRKTRIRFESIRCCIFEECLPWHCLCRRRGCLSHLCTSQPCLSFFWK